MEKLIASGQISSLYETDQLDAHFFEAFTTECLLTPLAAWVRVGNEATLEDALKFNFPLDCNPAIAVFGTYQQIDDACQKIIQYAVDHSLEKAVDDLEDEDAIDCIIKLKCDDTGIYCVAFGGYYEDTTTQEELAESLGLDYLTFGAQMDDTPMFICMFDGGFDHHISEEMMERLAAWDVVEDEEEFILYSLLRFTEGTSDKIYGRAATDSGEINFWGKLDGHLSFKECDGIEASQNVRKKRAKGYKTYFPTPTIRSSIKARLAGED